MVQKYLNIGVLISLSAAIIVGFVYFGAKADDIAFSQLVLSGESVSLYKLPCRPYSLNLVVTSDQFVDIILSYQGKIYVNMTDTKLTYLNSVVPEGSILFVTNPTEDSANVVVTGFIDCRETIWLIVFCIAVACTIVCCIFVCILKKKTVTDDGYVSIESSSYDV